MATSKTAKPKATANAKNKTVNDYIDALPAGTKKIVKELRKTIKEIAPKAEEKISYGIPSFHFHGMLIWYAAWSEHISLYPRSRTMEAAIKELANYEGGKGTIKFPLDKPLPFALIKKIVKFRLEENLRKAKSAGKAVTAR